MRQHFYEAYLLLIVESQPFLFNFFFTALDLSCLSDILICNPVYSDHAQ